MVCTSCELIIYLLSVASKRVWIWSPDLFCAILLIGRPVGISVSCHGFASCDRPSGKMTSTCACYFYNNLFVMERSEKPY